MDNYDANLGMEADLVTRERIWTPDLEVRSDGRTIYGLIVPFDQVATVNDGRGAYQEVFRRGSFAKTIQENGSRVKLMANHDQRRFPLGRATMLREDAAGVVGEFRTSKTRDADEALELVRDGALDSFSVGFRPVKHRKNLDGVVERQEVGLREVSLVAFPAYAGALVAGVRAMAGYDEAEPDASPASFSMPISTGTISHNGYGAFDMTLVTSNASSDTPAEEAAEGTSEPRAADITGEPVRHSTGPTQAERRQRLLVIRGVTTP